MRVTLLGSRGFVGSAFARLLRTRPDIELIEVEIDNYAEKVGTQSDVVIEAACNSVKFLADQKPFEEFELSVTHRLHTLRDFPARLHLHVSSVDVYSDLTSPETTREESPIDRAAQSHYGFHKLLAEELVQHYAPRWLIVRLAGMVGPRLRKNPVYDILNGQPLRIHPESRYQFMHTDDVARLAWALVEEGITGEVYNICGDGLITPREIAALAGRELDLSLLPADAPPRVVHASNAKLRRLMEVPRTHDAVAAFVGAWPQSAQEP
ncbi:MAG: NAD(P)-dependent oxidoreductase [Armatimonadota bacterium]|nr:NAD(P)-dependent oxidoreductase [Armatimonadota bacterium]